MNEKEKTLEDIDFKRNSELNIKEFYKELNKAISTKNIQSIYELSKIFTRYFIKNINR